METTQQACASIQAVGEEGYVSPMQMDVTPPTESSGEQFINENVINEGIVAKDKDDLTLKEMRIIECRKQRDDLFMAICRGNATPDQEAAYKQACAGVHDAQVEYSAAFFGPVVCNSGQTAVA